MRNQAKKEPIPSGKSIAEQEDFERLGIHYRIQHILLFTSFLTLVFTGLPLRYYGVGYSRILMNMWGGLEIAAIIHRTAAIIMIAMGVYHIAYMIYKAYHGRLTFAMIPTVKDVYDMLGMMRYYFGLDKEKPKFGKFTYWEKFDYWAVFWGMFIMVGSGFVLWFPIKALSFLPVMSISMAKVMHSEEALLAASAIFLWHFYNVHLKSNVFPMSWVWITGRISKQEIKEHHTLEYQEMLRREKELNG